MSPVLLKHNEALLLLAQNIFGLPFVQNAWFAETPVASVSRKDIDALTVLSDGFSSDSPTSVNLPTNSAVVIEFSNGRKVLFGSSEWAEISLVAKPLFYIDK